MQMIQAIIGVLVLVVVLIIAGVVAVQKTERFTIGNRFVFVPLCFIGTAIGCYLALTAIGILFWVIWGIGIVLREILQWLVEAVLYPWHWLF